MLTDGLALLKAAFREHPLVAWPFVLIFLVLFSLFWQIN